MDGRQPRVSTEVRDVVLKRLGRSRLLGSRTLQGADVRPHGGDLGARCLVGLLEVLNAPDQRLVAGDLVRGSQESGLTWLATKNPVAIATAATTRMPKIRLRVMTQILVEFLGRESGVSSP